MATFQTQYPVNTGPFNFDYRTPPRTPASGRYHNDYYSPRQYIYTPTPSKGHNRRATNDGPTYAYTTTTYTTSAPRKETHYSTPAQYTTTTTTATAQSASQRRKDFVSDSDPRRSRTHTREYVSQHRGEEHTRSRSKHRSKAYVVVEGDVRYDSSREFLPRYERFEAKPPAYSQRQQSYYDQRPRADHHYYDQVPIYDTADSRPRERQRRYSHTASKTPHQQPPPRRPSTATKPIQTATDEDARRAGIPAGYSIKNWDPTEEPILLLGSVFDANSLGKWIYDWTVFFYGPSTPMSAIAADLWILLIELAQKVKRAEDGVSGIRRQSNRDMVDEFLDSGERLWQRFNQLLKICENFMWKAAKKESGHAKKVTMGKNSGCEFVDSIFGRDRELERTEQLMTGMRLWSMRFDANCDDILRNPTA